jgi:hypothetical protein
VDGDHKMVLGLVWRLILTTQIAALQDASGIVGDESTQETGARAALLAWCRARTEPRGVSVNNFGKDWKNGMAFLALLVSQKPDLLNFQALDPNRADENLRLAFSIAETEFGVPQLLEVSDLASDKPDERSIMTYVSAMANRFEVAARENAVAEKEQALQKQAQEELERLRAAHALELEKAKLLKEEADRKMEEAAKAQQEALLKQQVRQSKGVFCFFLNFFVCRRLSLASNLKQLVWRRCSDVCRNKKKLCELRLLPWKSRSD